MIISLSINLIVTLIVLKFQISSPLTVSWEDTSNQDMAIDPIRLPCRDLRMLRIRSYPFSWMSDLVRSVMR